MNIRSEIAQAIHSALVKLDASLTEEEIVAFLEVPKDSARGDYAFPCFPLAKALRRGPPQIAGELAGVVSDIIAESASITKVEPAGPYLNFFINKAGLAADLVPQILDGSFLSPRPAVDEKIMVEYSQPNTHKALHVGHTRCAAMGDTFVRMFEWLGHETIAANYLGDEGTHVARCLWYYLTQFDGEVPETNRGEFLGELYTKGTELLDLKSLTDAPYPGVTVAKVTESKPHAEETKWTVVTLETAEGEKTVVCGGSGFSTGDFVAWARPGARAADRAVGEVDKKGVLSQGMICAPAEIGLPACEDPMQILVLDPNRSYGADLEIGAEVAELYRKSFTEPNILAAWHSRRDEVGEILLKLENQDEKMHHEWQVTKDWSVNDFLEAYAWLNCRFDVWFYESEFADSSKELVRSFQDKGVFIESEGAVGADLEADKLGFAILIKSNGTATYASRDLTLAARKFDEFGVDRSVYVVDSAQSLHFKQVFKCLERMGYEQASKCHHHGYERVVLANPDQGGGIIQMSSSSGNVVLFSQLRDGLVKTITEKHLNQYRGDWSDEEIADTTNKLARAAVRYGMLKQTNESTIAFDLDRWTDAKGDTGPYLLYAYARIQRIKEKVGQPNLDQADWSLLTHETESDLLSLLGGYPDVVARAAERYSPNLICTYIYELCRQFSRFNRECHIKNAESDALRAARLCLAEATGKIIQHGLGLLGIETVDRM